LAFAKPRGEQLLPLTPPSAFDRFTVSHCFAVGLLWLITALRAIQVRSEVGELMVLRYRYYTITIVTFLMALCALMCFEALTDGSQAFLMNALITGFALLMEHLHSEAELNPYEEYPQQGEQLLGDAEAELGAEQKSGEASDGHNTDTTV
jgi:L-asparagine transporter-like permease